MIFVFAIIKWAIISRRALPLMCQTLERAEPLKEPAVRHFAGYGRSTER
jgi:hypothetical protein